MSIPRYMAAVLISALMSLGGLGGYGAHMAMAGQSDTSSTTAMAVHHVDNQTHAQHAHEDHTSTRDGQDAQFDASGSGAPNCCLFACGMATMLPAPGLGFSGVGWETLRLRAPADSMMAGRSVSPLRRPPRLGL